MASAEPDDALATQIRQLRNKDPQARIAAAVALGERGPAAANAIPELTTRLRERNPAVREAMVTALAKIGPAAVPPVVEMLKNGDLHPNGGADDQSPAFWGLTILQKLDPQVKVKVAIPALAALMAEQTGADKVWENALEALVRMGPEAVPAMAQAIRRGIGLTDIAIKIGPAAKQAIPQLIQAFPKMDYQERWQACHALAAAQPDLKDVPAILQLLKDDEYGMAQDIGVILDRIGTDAVPAVVELLGEKDWYPRWGATMMLEMMGPKAKDALPALERAFKDEKEDIDVRVGAARAIGSIKGDDPFALYQQIPDVANRIVKATHDKTNARREQFMRSEAAVTAFAGNPNRVNWQSTAQFVYRLATGIQADPANADLKKAAEKGWNGAFMDVNLVRSFMLFRSRSEYFPGRLKPDTEAAMTKYFFDLCDNQNRDIKQWDEQGQTTKDLVPGQAFAMALHANKPMNFTSRDYLSLSVLKDDPAYADRKFTAGDTVTERFNAWNGYFGEFLKDWALNGLWVELGSTCYEYHTYPSFVNLADFAPDPEVRKRARMYLDLCFVEAQQISIAGLRGGSKSRAKKGGLGSDLDPYVHLLFGERGRPLVHAPIAASAYQAPDAAILLHKLGAPVASFEIADRQAGEIDPVRKQRQGRKLLLNSHMINYTYRTPDYVMGCSIYDPNRSFAPNCEGRWSGVIFRDRAIISLDAYTGEKWNVQSKDVMITQRRLGAYYGGYVHLDFTSGFEKVERDGWLFVTNGEAFAAINVLVGGYTWTDPVKGSLDVKDQCSPIIIQTGSVKEYGSFAKFQDAILKAPLKLEYAAGDEKQLQKVDYTGPHSSKVEFFTQTKPFILPKVDGKTVDLDLKYNYQSPYMQNKVGSDVVNVSYGTRKWAYDFGRNTVTEVH
jgi:HEAT repeat protein